MVRLIKESEINPRHSYFTVIAMYYADDGAPSYLKGVVVHEVFDTGLPYDKQYYKGDTFFSEKSFYDEDEAYAYKNKLVKYGTPVSESIKRSKRVKEDFTVTDADYGWDITEEVANIMQDMDWRDNLDGNYETYDDEWDAYVDQVLAQLESDPQEIIDWLEDEEDYDNNRSLIRKIEKYFL